MAAFIFIFAICILKVSCQDMRHEMALLHKERQDNQIDPSRLVAVFSEYIIKHANRNEETWEPADFELDHKLIWESFLKEIGAFPSLGTLNVKAKPLIVLTEKMQKGAIGNAPLLATFFPQQTGSRLLTVESVLERFYEAYRDQVVKTGTADQLDKQFKSELMAEFITLSRWIIKQYLEETGGSVPSKDDVSKADLDKVARKCAFKKKCILKSLKITSGVVALGLAARYGIPWLWDMFKNSANSKEPNDPGRKMPSKPKEAEQPNEAKKPDNTEIDEYRQTSPTIVNKTSSSSWKVWIFLGVLLSILVLSIIGVLLYALWYRQSRTQVQFAISDSVQNSTDSSVASSAYSIYGPPPTEPFPSRFQNQDLASPLNPSASFPNLSSLGTQRRAEEFGLPNSNPNQLLNRRYSV